MCDSVVLRPDVICASLQQLCTADVGQVGVAVCLENLFAFSNIWQDWCFAFKFHQKHARVSQKVRDDTHGVSGCDAGQQLDKPRRNQARVIVLPNEGVR